MVQLTRNAHVLLALGLVVLAPACAKNESQAQGAKSPEMTPAAAANEKRLSDDQIWKVAETINRNEAVEARFVEQRAQSPLVKDFAKHMVQMHFDEARTERDAASRLGVNPIPSPLSERYASLVTDDLKTLRGLPPADFDREYIGMEVRDHQRAIDTIDHELLPQAKDPQLKAELLAMRTRVAQQLDEAKRIQGELSAATQKQPMKEPKEKIEKK
jgi:putative membrane protein